MKRGFRSKVSFVNYPNVCMPHFSVRVLDKMAAKTTAVPHPFYSPRAKQHFDTRRLSGIGICWNGKRNSVSARVRKRKKENKKKKKRKKEKIRCPRKVLAADVFRPRHKPLWDEKQKKRERQKEKNSGREKERERERERRGRRLDATELFQRTILFADTHVQRERSFFGVSDSNRVLLPDSDVLEGA